MYMYVYGILTYVSSYPVIIDIPNHTSTAPLIATRNNKI